MKNAIYLRRAKKVIVNEGTNKISDKTIATMNKNLETFGFTMSRELFTPLKNLPMPELVEFYAQLVSYLKKMVGAHFYTLMLLFIM